MSKFLSFFSTNKKKITKPQVQNGCENETDIPNLARKMSLTKSGRMKEKKRKTVVTISEYFLNNGEKTTQKGCDNQELDEIVREMQQIAEKND